MQQHATEFLTASNRNPINNLSAIIVHNHEVKNYLRKAYRALPVPHTSYLDVQKEIRTKKTGQVHFPQLNLTHQNLDFSGSILNTTSSRAPASTRVVLRPIK